MGRKTPEYHALYEAVKEAAKAEILRTGWVTADDEVATSIVLYRSTSRRQDCGNIGKVESDALTAAAVWVDDRYAKPWHTDIEYDPSGPDRVTIVLRRRFSLPCVATKMAASKCKKKPVELDETALLGRVDPLGEVNGVPTPRSVILRQLREKNHR